MNDHDDLPELDEEELAMLAAFQAEDRPPAPSIERVRARVLESTTVAPAGTVLRGPWQWPAAIAIVAAAAAALLLVDFGGEDATAVNRQGVQQAVDTPEAAEGGHAIIEAESVKRAVPPPDPVPEHPAVDAPPPPEPLVEPEPPTRKPVAKRQPVEPAPTPEPVSSLAAETRLLDRARKAVAGGRPSEALVILREAESAFPRGVLGQERSALRVVALCDAGQLDAGRQAAKAFVKAHPQSALRARVESACPSE